MMPLDRARWFEHEQITVSNTAVGLTSATFASAKVAKISVDKAAGGYGVRYRFSTDGNPTDSVGMEMEAGDEPLVIAGAENLNRIRFIRRDMADVQVNVLYGK